MKHLTESQINALLYHKWPIRYENIENDEGYAVQQQLEEFRKSGENHQKYKCDELEAATVTSACKFRAKTCDALKLDLQELELNRVIVAPNDWLGDFDLAENTFIKHVKGLDGFVWRMYVKTMKTDQKLSLLLKISTELVKSEIIMIPRQSWQASHVMYVDSVTERKLVNQMGFVLFAYRIEFWWWYAVEYLYKFIMIAVLPFIYPGSPVQLVFGALVIFWFLILNLTFQPHRSDGLNSMQSVVLLCQFLTLFIGIIIAVGEYQGNEFVLLGGDQGSVRMDITLISVLVATLNSLTLIWPFVRSTRVAVFLSKGLTSCRKLFQMNLNRQTFNFQALSFENTIYSQSDPRVAANTLRDLVQANSVHAHVDTSMQRNVTSEGSCSTRTQRNFPGIESRHDFQSIVLKCPAPLVNLDFHTEILRLKSSEKPVLEHADIVPVQPMHTSPASEYKSDHDVEILTDRSHIDVLKSCSNGETVTSWLNGHVAESAHAAQENQRNALFSPTVDDTARDETQANISSWLEWHPSLSPGHVTTSCSVGSVLSTVYR